MDDLLRFWGVRGSIASPGPSTAGVGGNTSCVEVRLGGERLVLDAGTGLRSLGAAQGGEALRATLLFGHLHWDHIQGVPFLSSLFDARTAVRMIGPRGLRAALERQMSRPSFPVTMAAMAARIEVEEVDPGASFTVGDVLVTTAPLDHPGGCIGYRLARGDLAVAYACDVEHRPRGLDERLFDLARGAEVLVHDAQYTPEEQAHRTGWGHSTFEKGAELADVAGVRWLALTHHDPGRDDAGVARIEARARELFPRTFAAREGIELPLRPRPARDQPRPWLDQGDAVG